MIYVDDVVGRVYRITYFIPNGDINNMKYLHYGWDYSFTICPEAFEYSMMTIFSSKLRQGDKVSIAKNVVEIFSSIQQRQKTS